jgi:hypothetical protein
MFVERASHVVSARKFQVDRSAAQLGSTGSHGINERASYTLAALIRRDAKIAQPRTLFTGMSFKSSTERSKTNYAISVLGNEAFTPSVGTKAAV